MGEATPAKTQQTHLLKEKHELDPLFASFKRNYQATQLISAKNWNTKSKNQTRHATMTPTNKYAATPKLKINYQYLS